MVIVVIVTSFSESIFEMRIYDNQTYVEHEDCREFDQDPPFRHRFERQANKWYFCPIVL